MAAPSLNFITTLIGFGMSATFIFFVCARIICWRLSCSDSRQMFEIESTIDLEQPEHRASGLEPAMVAAIPTMRFTREAFSSTEDVQCSICLGEYQEKEELRIMPKCGHSFHLSCIDVWLRKQASCPVCRFPVLNSLESRNMRHINIGGTQTMQSVDSPETSQEHSRQWLLPGLECSSGEIREQGHVDSSAQIAEHAHQEVNEA